jgi:hypothetical protein
MAGDLFLRLVTAIALPVLDYLDCEYGVRERAAIARKHGAQNCHGADWPAGQVAIYKALRKCALV